MTTYRITDIASGTEEIREFDSSREAMAFAYDWMAEGYESDDEPTSWWDYRVEEVDGDWEEWGTYTCDPAEPECEDGHEHHWHSPHEIVGGCKENPGVWGSGGGVLIHEVCKHCGCHRRINTWATRPDNGEQGLESISYETAEETEEYYQD